MGGLVSWHRDGMGWFPWPLWNGCMEGDGICWCMCFAVGCFDRRRWLSFRSFTLENENLFTLSQPLPGVFLRDDFYAS